MTGDGRLDDGSAAATDRSARAVGRADDAPLETELRLPFRVDIGLTLAPLRHGPGDPTIRFGAGEYWRATRTHVGPATIRLRPQGDRLAVMAWGPGAEAGIDGVPRLLGAGDDPTALELSAGPLRDLARRFAAVRFARTDAVMESLVPAVIEQKVIGIQAQRSYRALVLRYGERAPGPSRSLARAAPGGARLDPVLRAPPARDRAAPCKHPRARRPPRRLARGGAGTLVDRGARPAPRRSTGSVRGPRPRRPGPPAAIPMR